MLPRATVGEIQPRPWETPLDAMTCEGLHVVTAANGVFTSRTGESWRHERVDANLRLMRLYCHRGQPWAVGFPGVVVRRQFEGSWQVELRRDAPHPDETHVSDIRAVFDALELVDGRLRAYGRTATGEEMSFEQRGEEWVDVPNASPRITYLPESLCGARRVPRATSRGRPTPNDVSGLRARSDLPSGYRYGEPAPSIGCSSGSRSSMGTARDAVAS